MGRLLFVHSKIARWVVILVPSFYPSVVPSLCNGNFWRESYSNSCPPGACRSVPNWWIITLRKDLLLPYSWNTYGWQATFPRLWNDKRFTPCRCYMWSEGATEKHYCQDSKYVVLAKTLSLAAWNDNRSSWRRKFQNESWRSVSWSQRRRPTESEITGSCTKRNVWGYVCKWNVIYIGWNATYRWGNSLSVVANSWVQNGNFSLTVWKGIS